MDADKTEYESETSVSVRQEWKAEDMNIAEPSSSGFGPIQLVTDHGNSLGKHRLGVT
jgi:hypothetical protein